MPISDIWRCPLKSVPGERVDSAEIGAHGIVGDRRYALRDCTTGLGAGAELVDVVDLDDRVIEVVTRAAMRAGGLRHRAVYLIVQSTSGALLVHQRSFDKDIAPGWWDIAVGGVVAAGETYDVAARRELAEEIGVSDASIEPLGDGRYDDDPTTADARQDDGTHYEGIALHVLGRVYRVMHDGPFTFADGEVIAAEWVEPLRLPIVLAERGFCPDSLAVCLPFLGVLGTRS